jgi:hypothetical protein
MHLAALYLELVPRWLENWENVRRFRLRNQAMVGI